MSSRNDEVEQLCRKLAQYCRNAANCLQTAQARPDIATKLELLALAQAWLRLATEAQKNSANEAVYKVMTSDFLVH